MTLTWHWHAEVALGLEALLVGYLVFIGPLRRRRGWGPQPPPARVAAFLGGTAILAGALLGPLAEWAEHVALSAHMVQHLLLILVVPVLWLLGLPPWLLAPIVRVPIVGRLGFGLTRPLPALALASAVQVAWHLPSAFDAALRVESLHALEHVSFLATGLLLWWPVVGPAPEWPRPVPPAQLLYLFLATIPMMAIAAPITLAEDALYPAYAAAGRPWPLDPKADQELAGILMWVGGMLGYLVAGTVVFFRWAGPAARDDDEAPLHRHAGTEMTAHGA
jgi:putative membrane protein